MRKAFGICAVLLLITVIAVVFLTSCGQKEVFEKVDVVTTTKPVTEPVTYVYSNLDVFGTRMGMSLEETQAALGEPIAIRTNNEGIVFFTINRTGLDFVNEGMEASVYFIYDTDVRLQEIQYASNNDTGFVREEAIRKFDSLYGKRADISYEDGKVNHVWFKDGDYIVITNFADGQNAVSYFSEEYFKTTQPEEAKAYSELE